MDVSIVNVAVVLYYGVYDVIYVCTCMLILYGCVVYQYYSTSRLCTIIYTAGWLCMYDIMCGCHVSCDVLYVNA